MDYIELNGDGEVGRPILKIKQRMNGLTFIKRFMCTTKIIGRR